MKNTAYNLHTAKNPESLGIEHQASSVSDFTYEMAEQILAEVMMFRRIPASCEPCRGASCTKCASPHLPKIINAIKHKKPIPFVLPAFPGKSPNPDKVLGHLPDLAERLSFEFLGNLCQRIKAFYAPGIKIILCSDGRVFSDVVGMKECHVSAYQRALDGLIKTMSLSDLSTFNLDDFYGELNFDAMREELLKHYGQPMEQLKQRIRLGAQGLASPDDQALNRMYRGMTRFLFEDAKHPGQTRSHTAIQKEARVKAYELIRKSNAWSDLIAEHFPEAVRLSIHPQTCGANKLGLRLIGNECWMTPWHGVAVEGKQGYLLLKRRDAESLGAQLMTDSDGRPSHYKLFAENKITAKGVSHEL